MPTNIEQVLWSLDDDEIDDDLEIEVELEIDLEVDDDPPNVFVDPTLEAFCVVGRAPTPAPRDPDRVPLDLILRLVR